VSDSASLPQQRDEPPAPAKRPVDGELRARPLTATVLVPLVLYVVYLGALPMLAAVIVLTVLAQREFYGLIEDKGAHPIHGFGLAAWAALPLVAYLGSEYHATMLLTATLCLLALGAVMVFSASSTTRVLSDGGLSDSAFYLKRTLLFGAVGLLIMHLAARHGLGFFRRLTPAILGVSLFLLVAVLFAGSSANGSTRWLGSGFLQIQPSELVKVALILYAADLLARKPKRVRSLEVVDAIRSEWLPGERIPGPPVHGTGCALSTAIAAGLAKGESLRASIEEARRYVKEAIRRAHPLANGARLLAVR